MSLLLLRPGLSAASGHQSDPEWQDLQESTSSSELPIPRPGRRIACLSCRRAKKRCDHKLPRCTACALADAECEYPVAKTKRGPRKRSLRTEALKEAPPLPSILGASRKDPFSTFPIPSEDYMHLIIDHFATEITIRCDPVSKDFPLRTELIPLALVDPTLFHAMLCYGGSHFMSLTGKKNLCAPTLAHRGEVLRLLNESLRDPQFKVEDKTVAAILCVAGYDVELGEQHSFHSHIRGLSVMVESMGGPQALGLKGLLADLLIWLDQLCSVSTGAKPYFQPDSGRPQDQDMLMVLSSNTSTFPKVSLSTTGFQKVARLPCMDSYMTGLLSDILSLHQFLQGKFTPTEAPIYMAKRSLIYRRLHVDERDYSKSTANMNVFCSSNVQEICRLVSIMYINTVLRGLTASCVVHVNLARRIKLLLIEDDKDSCWEENPEIRLWIAFFAAAVLVDFPLLRGWYAGLIGDLLGKLRLKSWKDTKATLSMFLWDERDWEPACRRVWVEVKESSKAA